MGRLGVWVLFILLSYSLSVFAKEDIFKEAVFSTTSKETTVESEKRELIGVIGTGLGGYGISYSRFFKNDINLWTTAYFQKDYYLHLDTFVPNTEIAHIEARELNRKEITVGVQKTFHLTSNKYWGVFGGLGFGLGQREYESKYYRPLCTFYCGIDPNPISEKNETHSYATGLGRAGINWHQIQIFNMMADFNVFIDFPLNLGSKKYSFTGPNGQNYSYWESRPIYFEAAIEI